MTFQHRIPKLYYSITETISGKRYEKGINAMQIKFPDYNITSSKGMFKNHQELEERIEDVINSTDVMVFSFPETWNEDYFFNDKFDREITQGNRSKKVLYIIRGNQVGLLSDRNWMQIAIKSVNQRR